MASHWPDTPESTGVITQAPPSEERQEVTVSFAEQLCPLPERCDPGKGCPTSHRAGAVNGAYVITRDSLDATLRNPVIYPFNL